jgi:NADH-quinone oxidoreductase subunit E
MRDMVKPQLLKLLAAKSSGKPVTAHVVTRMVQEDLPEPQKGMIMQALGIKKPAEKKIEKEKAPTPAAGDTAQLKGQEVWEGSSKSMFEQMIKEVPESLRDVFRGKLMDILRQKAKGGPYQESYVTEIVNEIVPEPFKSNIIKAFVTMGGVDVDVVEGIVASFPGGQESLTAILHALKNKFGYIPEEALRVVSQKKGVFLSTLYRLVTSFQAFPTASPKKYTVSVCNGTGCHLKGSGSMLKKLEDTISANDVPITLEKVRCLGCCDLSPAVLVNGEVYGGPDAQAKISEMLGE